MSSLEMLQDVAAVVVFAMLFDVTCISLWSHKRKFCLQPGNEKIQMTTMTNNGFTKGARSPPLLSGPDLRLEGITICAVPKKASAIKNTRIRFLIIKM